MKPGRFDGLSGNWARHLCVLKKGHKWFEDKQGWGLIIEQKKHQEHI